MFCICYAQSAKTLNERKKTIRTRCGNSETATTRNFASWTFCNSHNAFWHVKNCHDAKFTSSLLDKTTATRSGNIELPEHVVVVFFYSHNTVWGKSYRTVEESKSKWTVYKFSNVLMKNTCNVGVMKNGGKVRELLEWHLELHLILFKRYLHFSSMQYLLQLQLVNPYLRSHWGWPKRQWIWGHIMYVHRWSCQQLWTQCEHTAAQVGLPSCPTDKDRKSWLQRRLREHF
jgi:hypothetical protein